MKKKDMEEFRTIITGYNVKLMIVGHTHGDGRSLRWNGIWQIDVSGSRFAHIAYDQNTNKLAANWVDKNGNIEEIVKPTTDTITPDSYYDMSENYVDY